MRFSQRMGITPVSKAIQLESMDEALKNGLWNIVTKVVFENIPHFSLSRTKTQFTLFKEVVWDSFYGKAIDTAPTEKVTAVNYLRTWFYDSSWEQVYDFTEFLASEIMEDFYNSESFTEAVNAVLVREVSGYRFVGRLLVPITNQTELSAIHEAIEQTTAFTSIQGANIHLSAALEMLSNRQTPDYRNSIKESLSAVETTCRVLTGENTLGKALKKLDAKGITLDGQLQAGFENIYAYSNGKEVGIRHSIIAEHKKPDFQDAKFMLVAACAFINFLLGKHSAAGLTTN